MIARPAADADADATLALWNPPPFLTGCSQAVGEGFGIPLVIRYVLEVCASTEEAVRVLRQVPVHMSYNVTALGAAGQRATAYLAPDRPARITKLTVVTNHQGRVQWEPTPWRSAAPSVWNG